MMWKLWSWYLRNSKVLFGTQIQFFVPLAKKTSPQAATVKLIFNLSTRLNSKKRWYSETNKIKSRCQLWLLHWLSVVPSAENKVKLIFVNLCVLKGLISKSRVPSNIFNKQPVSQTFYGTSLIFTVFCYFTEK